MLRGLRALKRQQVLGLNRRNADYLLRYNARSQYPMVDDKLATKRLAIEHNIAVPPLYAVVAFEHQLADTLSQLQTYRDFVIKPAHGRGGDGIWVVDAVIRQHFRLANGDIKAPEVLLYHLSSILAGVYSLSGHRDVAVIEHRVLADSCFDSISAIGVADIRVVTLLGYPVMAMARLPTRASAGKANLHQGAVGVGIDLASGITLGGVQGQRLIDVHPDTLNPLAGRQVPHWQQVMNIAATAHDMTALGYLGVDIVLDHVCGPMMLEVNARPGLAIQLANRRGLLARLQHIQTIKNHHGFPQDRVYYSQQHLTSL